jgi:hypothetical protein
MPSIAFLFDMAAKSTVLLGVACLLILALRRTSAAARYFTWICAFASVLALPVLSELLPRWDLRVKTPLVGTVVSKAAATDVAPITAQRPDAGGAPVRLKRSVPWLAVICLAGHCWHWPVWPRDTYAWPCRCVAPWTCEFPTG